MKQRKQGEIVPSTSDERRVIPRTKAAEERERATLDLID